MIISHLFSQLFLIFHGQKNANIFIIKRYSDKKSTRKSYHMEIGGMIHYTNSVEKMGKIKKCA